MISKATNIIPSKMSWNFVGTLYRRNRLPNIDIVGHMLSNNISRITVRTKEKDKCMLWDAFDLMISV